MNQNRCRSEHTAIIKKIIKMINDTYKGDKIFDIKCLYNSKKQNASNIFFVPGYINGIIDPVTLWNDKEITWIAQLISILDLEKTNLYLVQWDSLHIRQLSLSKNILKDIYNSSFPRSYYNAHIAGKKLGKFLSIFNGKRRNKVVLIGHSLGSKIILDSLNELYTLGYSTDSMYPIVNLVILLGTTEYGNKFNFDKISKTVIYKPISAYNTKDKILIFIFGLIYQMSLNVYNVVGLKRISKIDNINCTKQMNLPDEKRCNGKCIDGTNYGHNYSSIIKWIFNHRVIKRHSDIIPILSID